MPGHVGRGRGIGSFSAYGLTRCVLMFRVGGLDPISRPLSLMVIRLLSICRLVLAVRLLLLGLRVGSVLGKLSLVLVVVVAGVASKLVTATAVTPVISSSAASTTSEVVAAIVIEVTVITLIVSCLES